VTGIFEGTTTAAVKAYQADRGLPATGVVSDATWDLIKAGSR
jgi:peptidoglycan hydrolase-like protein with peptidoglycan-binding domain